VAFQAQLGVPITLLHPVRDINGNFVAGQASAVTKSLIGPDRLAASEAVTLADHAVAGWVTATVTPTRLGTYTLSLTSPGDPIADGFTKDYDLVVLAGLAPSATLLTSLDRVRTMLDLRWTDDTPIQPGQPHAYDAMLNLLISEVSDEYQQNLGRTFAEQTYTEYIDGSGRRSLVLGAGPVVSVTSVNVVEYKDDGAGGVTEVLTAVPRYTFVIAGQRNQPRYAGRGRLDLIGCATFTPGPRNHKVVYVAGFATIPEAIVGLATHDVVSRFLSRDTGHLLSQALADGTISYMRPGQMQEMRDATLDAWRLEAA
jgi:hypothetical protein